MRRLTLLLFAVSFAVVAPAAHAAPAAPGGPTAIAAQAPGPDRDGDGAPDAFDMCPDDPGMISGCPDPDGDHLVGTGDQCPNVAGTIAGCPDRDGDLVTDAGDQCPDQAGNNMLYHGCPQETVDPDGDGVQGAADQCPTSYSTKQANGCDPFVFRYFLVVQKGVKDFAADKRNDTMYCSGGPLMCQTGHVTFTLSAQTAKAAGIKNRRVGSITLAIPGRDFDRGISRANGKRLARLKKITFTVRAWVTLTTGKTMQTPAKTFTLSKTGFLGHQFNSAGTTDPEGI
jgi:hypothetical protein